MAKAFVGAGASVCIIDLNHDAGLALVEELGDRAVFVEGNVTVEETWRNALEKCRKLFGGVQILVVSTSAPFPESRRTVRLTSRSSEQRRGFAQVCKETYCMI